MEEQDFIKDYISEMKPFEFELDMESLIVYNFGYDRPLPFPSIALTPDTNMSFNLQTTGMQSPNRRSIVVVGEKFVGLFEDSIMLVVDRIHEESQALPFAAFLQSENDIKLEEMGSYNMSHMSPSLVGILNLS